MDEICIRRFGTDDTQGVVNVILPIQQDEFGIAITVEDQPDLLVIGDFYQQGHGDFLVATIAGQVVGTVGMKDIGQGQVALRKMFVAAPWRGRTHGVARQLLAKLIALARDRGVDAIFLGTTSAFLAAHRFYEANGFTRIDPTHLPATFPRMAVDTIFYRLRLD